MLSRRLLLLSSMTTGIATIGITVVIFYLLALPERMKQTKNAPPPAIEERKADQNEQKKPRQELELSIEPDTKIIYPFEPLYFTINVKNISEKDVRILGSIWYSLVISISFEDEDFVEGWRGAGSYYDFNLKPGKENLSEAILFRVDDATKQKEDRFAFPKPGKFLAKASLTREQKTFESPAVEIRVKEPDEINEKAGHRLTQRELIKFLESGLDDGNIGAAEEIVARFPTSSHADHLRLAAAKYYRSRPLERDRDERLKRGAEIAKKVSKRNAALRMRATLMRLYSFNESRDPWWDVEREELLDEIESNLVAYRVAEKESTSFPRYLEILQDMVAIRRGDVVKLLRLSVDNQYGIFLSSFVRRLDRAGENGKKAIPKVREVMKDPDPKVRLLAAYALATLDPADQSGMDYLISVIRDAKSPLRLEAVISTQRRPDNPGLFEALIPILKEENQEIRRWALQVLLKSKRNKSREINAALDGFFKNPDPDFRLDVAELARNSRPDVALPALIELLKDANVSRKARAAENLRFIDLRSMAAQAKPALKPLIEALKDEHQDEDHGLRLQAAYALEAFGPDAKEAIPALTKALSEPNPEIRAAISEALKVIQGGK